MLRVRRNCSDLDTYAIQANILKERFLQKGYKGDALNNIIQEVANIPREECLKERDCIVPTNQHQLGFISGFHHQYRDVEMIFKRHWHILCRDRHLGDVLPSRPKFIYRRAPSFGQRVVKKILNRPNDQTIKIDLQGFYACRKCICCKTVKVINRGVTQITNADNETFRIREFITCNSSYVVYLLWCPCGLFYVGRTKRLLRVRIAEHLANIQKGFQYHSVSLHFKEKHNQDPSLLQFCGVDVVYQSWRGSNRVRDLSQRETRWIFLLKCLFPRGMNIELDLNCFISNS